MTASPLVAQSDPLAPAKPAPAMQAVLNELASLGGKPIETLTAVEARKQPSPGEALKQLMKREGLKPEKVSHISNQKIPGPGQPIPIRIYSPAGEGPFPIILYYHGGGFVIADIDAYDAAPRILANAVAAVVISVGYRQGPEHKFPAAHEDAFAAYQWALAHAGTFKGDAARVAVVGESAGGTLANAVSMMARDRRAALPIYQVLVYPITGFDFNTPSYLEYANAKPLSRAMMQWFFAHETVPGDEKDPRLVPLDPAANLAGLPPTTVITDQIDPLNSEGEAYAKKLTAAGIKVHYQNYDGVTHEFFGMGAVVPQAKAAEQLVAADLRNAFGVKPATQ